MADLGSDTDTDTDIEWEGDIAALETIPTPPSRPAPKDAEPIGDELV